MRHNYDRHPSVADSVVTQDTFNDRAPRPLNMHYLTSQASVPMLWRVAHLHSRNALKGTSKNGLFASSVWEESDTALNPMVQCYFYQRLLQFQSYLRDNSTNQACYLPSFLFHKVLLRLAA